MLLLLGIRVHGRRQLTDDRIGNKDLAVRRCIWLIKTYENARFRSGNFFERGVDMDFLRLVRVTRFE